MVNALHRVNKHTLRYGVRRPETHSLEDQLELQLERADAGSWKLANRRRKCHADDTFVFLETGADMVVHHQECARDPLLVPALLPQATRSIC